MTFVKPSNISPYQLTDLRRGIFLILVILAFFCKNLLGQSPYIQHYTTLEGLPSNDVYQVFQDSKKFIWFATDAGLARFDGNRFTYYRKQNGLNGNDVFDIKEDSFGRIWFFNINASLNFFYNNTIYNEKNAPFLDSLRNNDFSRKFFEDENRNIYFYDNPQRIIFSLDPKNHVTQYKFPGIPLPSDIKPFVMENIAIRYMSKNKNGEFTFWAPSGSFRTKQLSKAPELVSRKFRFKDIITSSNNKYILVRAEKKSKFEVKRFNDEIAFDEIAPLFSINSEFISSILEDKKGILWISTYDKGVYCIKNNKIIYHFDIKDAKTVIQDHENNIWICSLKDGVYKINPFFLDHEHFENSVFGNSGIFALCPNDSSGIWCTNGKMVYLIKNKEIYKLDFQHKENSFNQILQVGQHTLIVGETSRHPFALEGIRLNQTGKKICIDKMSQLKVPLKKIIYNKQKNEISSYNQLFLYFVKPDRLFKELSAVKTGERIYNTYYDTHNELILNAKKNYIYQNGTAKIDEGLSCFNNKIIIDHLNLDNKTELFNIEGDSLFLRNDGKLYNLSAAFEQPIDFQIKYLAYHDSTLLVATSRNIYVCNNPLKILKKIPAHLQLINLNFESIHDIECINDKLYVASDDGLTAIPFHDLYNTDAYLPIPYFQSIKINDQKNLVKHNPISLISGQRINISFSSINFSISPIIFSYKLEGADANWTIVKGSNVVLQNLPKGDFLFKLRARKPTSAWSEPVELNLKIKATLGRNPIFLGFIFLLLIGLGFLIILRRKNVELKRREMEHQLIMLEQTSLQAMMNPHFIFNALGSIQSFLLRNKPNEAGIYLSKFARLIRQNLNALNSAEINLEEEVDRLKNYLDLEKLRMENKFEYHINIDESIESEYILIPSMIIQPFIENSVWHGIANIEGKGFISIVFKLHSQKSLQITIEDTGIGIKNSLKISSGDNKHLKLGMTITRKRLKLLGQKYGIETSLVYSEKSPGSQNPGTCATMIVPFFYNNSGAQQDVKK